MNYTNPEHYGIAELHAGGWAVRLGPDHGHGQDNGGVLNSGDDTITRQFTCGVIAPDADAYTNTYSNTDANPNTARPALL